METATRHLLRLGHECIVHLGGSRSSPTFRARVDAYKRTMEDAGLGQHVMIVASEEYSIQAGADRMNELLQDGTKPTCRGRYGGRYDGCGPIDGDSNSRRHRIRRI
jgi:DNA-binding LacI/PurR family transcriptional regulator